MERGREREIWWERRRKREIEKAREIESGGDS